MPAARSIRPARLLTEGELELMTILWRLDGGRGMGFTGGHFHDNWANDNFRKVVLNTLVWLAKADVPANGIESKVTKEDLEANLDPKGTGAAKKKK